MKKPQEKRNSPDGAPPAAAPSMLMPPPPEAGCSWYLVLSAPHLRGSCPAPRGGGPVT